MIRKMRKEDLERVSDIWLDTNIKAHNFIAEAYWRDNFEMVKELLSQAEVYVYENSEEGEVQGFAGLSDDYIQGIFVQNTAQSGGIGKMLLNYVKNMKEQLTLNVYQKNTRAIKFYLREGFQIQGEGIDDNTGEQEYTMIWRDKV